MRSWHLASVGWLRKHLGWKKDSEGDEGPAEAGPQGQGRPKSDLMLG
jgi:hypothetical protein